MTYQGAGEGTAGQTTDAMDVDGSTEYPCIMRATDGHKVKYSTLVRYYTLPQPVIVHTYTHPRTHEQVHPENLISFTKAYSALLKASLTTLRKREKKKDRARSKKNTGAAAAPTLAKVEGPRRGAGRRKRMVRMRARLRVVLRTNRR